MSKKVCISGYYGFDNFGDETVLRVLCDNLKKSVNTPEITVFSVNPEKTSKTYGVNSVKTFDIKAVLRELKKADCLISGGGSLLQDATSKKSLLYYLFVIAFALFFKKDVIVFAQGIGPLNNYLLKKATFALLKKTKYITVRDKKSYELLINNGIECELCADPVWNIKPEKSEKSETIGIQLREYPCLTDELIKKLANFIIKNYSNKKIKLLLLQNKIDRPACERLKKSVLKVNPEVDIKIVENTSNEKLINDISSLKELIAMRYHACLIGIKSGVKVLPLSYDIKVESLAKEFNIPYIDLNSTENLEKTFEKYVNTEYEYDAEKVENKKFDFGKIEKIIK